MNCLKCHKEYIDQELKKTFIHQPFLANKCALCHTPDRVNNAADSDGKAVQPKKTKTLGINDNLARIHLFAIPKDDNPTVLFVEAKNDTSDPYRVKLKMPSFENLEPLASDAQPPKIYVVQVISVYKAALVSAEITWHTDELSKSSVQYGIGQAYDRTVQSSQFLSNHKVELNSLTPDATYNFSIISQDIYGNTRESQVYTFSTKQSFRLSKEEETGKEPGALKLESVIFKSEENYLIRITANQSVYMEISTYDIPHSSLHQKKSSKLPAEHPLLISTYESSMLVCVMCHPVLNENFSHPVHFRARLGNKIPDDYPRLPNGQMSCLTCHEYHASNHPNQMRKSAERELCTGCHKRSFAN